MSDRKIQIVNKRDIQPKKIAKHLPYEFDKYQVTDDCHENQCCIAVYEVPPLSANYPYHYHMSNEENFYIISGIGTLETPNGDRSVASGDFVLCPPGPEGAHKISNASMTEKLVYINFDAVHSPEVVIYPHSDKIGIIVHGETGTFYKKAENVSYYEGE